jgi:opacity protein-like surface antigen
MRKSLHVLLLATGACSALLASPAQAKELGWYAGVDFLSAFAFADDTAVQGLAGPRINVEEDDLVIGGAAQLGRGFGSWRAEVEYVWRYRFDYNSDVVTASGTNRFKDNVQTQSVMVNLFHDFHNDEKWTPYVGVGLGVAGNKSEVDRRNLTTREFTSTDNTETGLAWSLMAGMLWDLNKQWKVKLGYRYVDLGEISSGAFADGTVHLADDHYSHDLTLGLQYRF